MSFEFNSTGIWVNYIKQILYKFNLPSCKIFKSKNELLDFYSNSSGIDTFAIIKGNENFPPKIVRYVNGNIKEICPYQEGGYYRNFTKNLVLLNNQYDSYTHKYFGDYLRFLRDFNNLNLMSMYNCYNNSYKEDSTSKYLIVPVKYNQKYTVAFTSWGVKYVFTNDTSLGNLQTLFLDSNNPEHLKQSKFNNPSMITSPKPGKKQISSEEYTYDWFKEDELYLVIKVDIVNKYRLIVLEGDYTRNQNSNSVVTINHEKEIKVATGEEESITLKPEDAYNNIDIETLVANNLSLLQYDIFNTETQIPFADRLFEFIMHNVITDRYEVTSSALDVKEKLGLKNNSRFRNYERLIALEKIDQGNLKDLTGYIDKDMEVKI